jgi:hypothetical protein
LTHKKLFKLIDYAASAGARQVPVGGSGMSLPLAVRVY